MIQSTTKQLLIFTLLAASAFGNSQNFAFSASYDGVSNIVEIIDPGPPIVRFETVSTGAGSFNLNNYASTDIINMATGVGSGSSIFTAGNGDQLFGNFNVQVTPTGNPGQVALSGLLLFAGGTGQFAGASGEATLTGLGQFTSQTSANSHIEYDGRITLVPEPTTLAIALPALAVLVRRRRR